jgi:uncharacterized protein YciI
MSYFFCKLKTPRPTFSVDMTPAEQQLLAEHMTYWTKYAKSGESVIFGPVADPAGSYGITILEVADEATAKELTGKDPIMKPGAGFSYQIVPMPHAFPRDRV